MVEEKEDLEKWVMLYADELFTWAMHKTSSKENAEDLVQETFIAAFKSLNNFEGKSNPKTWLFSILKNKIADHYRKLYRTHEHENISLNQFFDGNERWILNQIPQNWNTADEANLLDNAEFSSTLQRCIENLPETGKASILMKFIQEKESKSICQELQISTTNYWQIMHRTKLQLRKCLELNWFKK